MFLRIDLCSWWPPLLARRQTGVVAKHRARHGIDSLKARPRQRAGKMLVAVTILVSTVLLRRWAAKRLRPNGPDAK
jgi:hypothetical protein